MIRKYGSSPLQAPTRKRLKLSTFRGVDTTVAEEDLPFDHSPKSYNFTLGKGVLESGVGVSTAVSKIGNVDWEIKKRSLNVAFLKMYHYRTHSLGDTLDRVVAYGENGHLYETSLNVANTSFSDVGAYGEVLSATTYTYNGNTGLLFSTPNGLYFLYLGFVTQLSFSEIFTTMCSHNDRVFAVLSLDEYKLYFSDDFDPANWNISLQEGGYISFTEEMGKIVKVLSFGGYVYIFFEHGIRRLAAYIDQTEFTLREAYLSVGRIAKDSVVICGDRILFAASDGVYSFDGVGVKKILTAIEGLFSKDRSDAFAAFHNGKYYLACSLDMDSEIAEGTNSLVIYDIWQNTHEIAHDIGLRFMLPLDTENISGVLTETKYPVSFLGLLDRSGKVDSTATQKVWLSPVTTLGKSGGRKLLREISLRCEGEVTLRVILNGVTSAYSAVTGRNVFRVRRPFDRLRVEIRSSSASVRVTEAELTVDFYGE